MTDDARYDDIHTALDQTEQISVTTRKKGEKEEVELVFWVEQEQEVAPPACGKFLHRRTDRHESILRCSKIHDPLFFFFLFAALTGTREEKRARKR